MLNLHVSVLLIVVISVGINNTRGSYTTGRLNWSYYVGISSGIESFVLVNRRSNDIQGIITCYHVHSIERGNLSLHDDHVRRFSSKQ